MPFREAAGSLWGTLWVRKKWKDRSFAAAVNRQDIEEGAAALGIELSDHIGTVLQAMQGIAAELELDGRLASS